MANVDFPITIPLKFQQSFSFDVYHSIPKIAMSLENEWQHLYLPNIEGKSRMA